MWFTLKNYLCEIWKINFRYLWEGLASFWWFWPVLDGCGLFCLVVDGFKYLWLVLGACDCFCYIPGMIKKMLGCPKYTVILEKMSPSLKSVTHTLQWWNLAELYLTLSRSKKYMNHVTHSPSFADISIFSTKPANFAISRNTDIDCMLIHSF